VALRDRPLGLILIVAYKAIWGTLEIAAGISVGWVPSLLEARLADDPQDQLANWLVAHAPLDPAHIRAATFGLIALGLLKWVLAVGIWRRSWLVRDLALLVLGVAGVFGLVSLAAHATWFRLMVVVTDLLIVLYIWRFLPRHLPPRPRRADTPVLP
jgi:uncharacterized membrane protein